MTPAESFFYIHAGHSHYPDESIEVGKIRTAVLLADAEGWAERTGITFQWDDDWMVENHVVEYDCYEVEPDTCETCIARNKDGEVVAALSCIDDATDEYRRVVQAELAREAIG